jgi:hypothetical protein
MISYFIQKYADTINRGYLLIVLDLSEPKTKSQILKYRKYIQIMLLNFLFFMFFFKSFE